jgi:hypothetical protein
MTDPHLFADIVDDAVNEVHDRYGLEERAGRVTQVTIRKDRMGWMFKFDPKERGSVPDKIARRAYQHPEEARKAVLKAFPGIKVNVIPTGKGDPYRAKSPAEVRAKRSVRRWAANC